MPENTRGTLISSKYRSAHMSSFTKLMAKQHAVDILERPAFGPVSYIGIIAFFPDSLKPFSSPTNVPLPRLSTGLECY